MQQAAVVAWFSELEAYNAMRAGLQSVDAERSNRIGIRLEWSWSDALVHNS